MKRFSIVLSGFLGVANLCFGGAQQDCFLNAMKDVTRVTVSRSDLVKYPDGKTRFHPVLDSTDRKEIERVAATIEMKEPEVPWPDPMVDAMKMEPLSFRKINASIVFYRGDQALLSFFGDESATFVVFVGPRAPHPENQVFDRIVTWRSSRELKRLLETL